MVKIEASTLEEAYKKASQEFDCSVVDLEVEVVQAPSSGLLGLFKKSAVILASRKGSKKPNEVKKAEQKPKQIHKDEAPKVDNNTISEIENGVKELLESSCFDMGLTELKELENGDIYIKIDGNDAALMIGKEGYRYKALSYLLHNWIKIKYDRNISLEIGEFLKNQDKMIDEYIEHFRERVEEFGRAQTKPLDGILIKLALEKLRAIYPNKYVSIKTLRDGKKAVLVQEFRREKP